MRGSVGGERYFGAGVDEGISRLKPIDVAEERRGTEIGFLQEGHGLRIGDEIQRGRVGTSDGVVFGLGERNDVGHGVCA